MCSSDRFPVTILYEERRRELVKLVKKMAEEGKIKLRNARRDANDELRNLKKSNEMSEDELFAAQEEVQKLTDKNIEKVDKIAIGKEKEIMEL